MHFGTFNCAQYMRKQEKWISKKEKYLKKNYNCMLPLICQKHAKMLLMFECPFNTLFESRLIFIVRLSSPKKFMTSQPG